MSAMRQWEAKNNMKNHEERIRRARRVVKSSGKMSSISSGSERASTSGLLIGILREFGIQQHYRVGLMLEIVRSRF